MPTNDPYGLLASGLPPELAAEARGLTRQQAIQEALLQQSLQPTGGVIDAGRYKVARSPLEGLAKVAQVLAAQYGISQGDKKMGDLSSRYQQMQADEVQKYQQMKAGAPAISAPSDDLGGGPGAPAMAGDPRTAVQMAMLSRNPLLNRIGAMDATHLNRGEDRADAAKNAKALLDVTIADRAAGRDQTEATRRDLAGIADTTRRDLAADADRRAREMQQFLVANRQPRQEVAPTVVEVMRDGKRVKIDARTDKIIGDAPPTAAMEKAGVAKSKLVKDLGEAITELEKATKDGGLIDKSTGSGIGSLVDMAGRVVGKATPGAIAAGQMAPIYDLVLKMVPRFEGPQSDKDTASYKEASGQLANPNIPNAQKKIAGREILRLMKARQGQFIDKAVAGTEADAGAPPQVRQVDW